ncbi:MAG: citrate synthase [Candidatus Omnitrophica bacterium]|nr:citrate synthase [Candidatus Omnitrophota bacterium]
MQRSTTSTQELPSVGQPPQESAKLTVSGKEFQAPVLVGTEQETGMDITRLRAQTGAITLDPGFANTGSCASAITFLDGEKGILRYRGYPIEQLAESTAYPEVAYLLIHGELPNKQQLERFNKELIGRMVPPKGIDKLFAALPEGIHPMAALSATTQALSAYYPQLAQPNLTREQMDEVILTLLAQVPILAGYGYRKEKGLPAVEPRKELSYTANTLNLWFGGKDARDPSETAVKAFRAILILHADHEQNCSTSTVRLVGSSRASAFTAISAGMGALWGPLHGGANQAVLEMLEQIQKAGGDMKKTLEMAKDKNSGFRLMGFGHRVYKNFDPRSRILMAAAAKVLSEIGVQDPLLDLAKKLEAAALKDDYFVSRKLYPNVDFYSGIILRALGIPTRQFTVIFALGRLAGWLAHWKEMLVSPDFRIWRPRQIYMGATQRAYVPVSQRG